MLPWVRKMIIRMCSAWDVQNLTSITSYTMMYEFGPLAARLGVEVKKENSIVEPWPTRLKRKQGGAWSQHEFNIFLGSDFSGLERYAEWRRIS
jgi:hypothetical protein